MRQLNAPFDAPAPDQVTASDAQRIVAVAKTLANGATPGVFITVDEAGMPRSRWMTAVSLEDFPILYALTAPTSRKLEHLQNNPRVSWMFADETLDVVINLMGTARVVSDAETIKRAWRVVRNKTDTPLFRAGTANFGFSVIATEITQIECTVIRARFPKLHAPGSSQHN